jgi:hypothetical protein
MVQHIADAYDGFLIPAKNLNGNNELVSLFFPFYT